MNGIFLKPEDVAQLLLIDVADVESLIEKGELACLQIAGQWRITTESLKEFISKGLRKQNLKSLERALNDYSTWVRVLKENPDLSESIESSQYDEGTFGAFLQNALAISHASESGKVVSIKSKSDENRHS